MVHIPTSRPDNELGRSVCFYTGADEGAADEVQVISTQVIVRE